MKPSLFAAALFAILLGVSSASAAEISDAKFGFRVSVPDEFKQLPTDDKEVIYQFANDMPSEGKPVIGIQFQRMGGTIPVGRSKKGVKLPEQEGIEAAIEDFDWQGRPMEILRMTADLGSGGKLNSYTLSFPLSGEAVQLVVAGPVDEDAKLRDTLKRVATSFTNTKPLHGESATPVAGGRELSSEERLGKLLSAIFKLSLCLLVIVFLVRAVFRAFRGKKA